MTRKHTQPKKLKTTKLDWFGRKIYNFCKENNMTIEVFRKIANVSGGTIHRAMTGGKIHKETRRKLNIAMHDISEECIVCEEEKAFQSDNDVSKYTTDQLAMMIYARKQGMMLEPIAKVYGVSNGTISAIVNHRMSDNYTTDKYKKFNREVLTLVDSVLDGKNPRKQIEWDTKLGLTNKLIEPEPKYCITTRVDTLEEAKKQFAQFTAENPDVEVKIVEIKKVLSVQKRVVFDIIED